jgi:DNA-binding phage protein
MPLTRNFKETVKALAEHDTAFRAALLSEAVEALLDGDTATGKTVLRDYINATVGFEALAESVGKDPKSLMRMLSKTGNPRAENLFAIMHHLQEATGVQLEVKAVA